jgi:hypothetical protein
LGKGYGGHRLDLGYDLGYPDEAFANHDGGFTTAENPGGDEH